MNPAEPSGAVASCRFTLHTPIFNSAQHRNKGDSMMKLEQNNRLATLAGIAALALAAGTAWAAAPEKDPGQQQATQATDRAAAANTATSAPATSSADMGSSDSMAAQTKFDALDVNHDGSIDKQEASVSKQLNAQFAKLDKNADGKLSMMEFNTAKDIASIKVDRKTQK